MATRVLIENSGVQPQQKTLLDFKQKQKTPYYCCQCRYFKGKNQYRGTPKQCGKGNRVKSYNRACEEAKAIVLGETD